MRESFLCVWRACHALNASANSSSMSSADAWKNPILTPLESLILISVQPCGASATSTIGGAIMSSIFGNASGFARGKQMRGFIVRLTT